MEFDIGGGLNRELRGHIQNFGSEKSGLLERDLKVNQRD